VNPKNKTTAERESPERGVKSQTTAAALNNVRGKCKERYATTGFFLQGK